MIKKYTLLALGLLLGSHPLASASALPDIFGKGRFINCHQGESLPCQFLVAIDSKDYQDLLPRLDQTSFMFYLDKKLFFIAQTPKISFLKAEGGATGFLTTVSEGQWFASPKDKERVRQRRITLLSYISEKKTLEKGFSRVMGLTSFHSPWKIHL